MASIPLKWGSEPPSVLSILDCTKNLAFLVERFPRDGARSYLYAALLVRPKVLIVDEITANLDPSVQYQLIDYLLRLNQTQGTTIIFSSHDLVHVTRMAKHIVLVAGGCKRLDMDNDAVSRYRSYRWQGDGAMGKLLMEGLARHKVRYFSFDNSAITAVAPDISQLESAFRAMDLPGITRPSEFEPATLEEVFLAYTR